METTTTGNASLKLLVLGFNDNERRLLQAIVKLSQRRQPALHLVDTGDGQAADVVLIDCLDANAKRWADAQPWLLNKPVGWVDAVGEVPPGHTKMKRPVQWPILPMLLSRLLFNAGDLAAGESVAASASQTAAPSRPAPPPPQRPAAQAPPRPAPAAPAQPARPAPAQRPASPQPAQAPSAHPAPTVLNDVAATGPKVLVVDDSLAVRQQLKTFLEQKGFVVTYAESGDAALTICKTASFDIILLDVLMPGIDGYETCRRVKGLPHMARSVKVVMLTSRTSPFDRIRSKMVGCDAYLTKPVQAQKLYDTLRQYVIK